MKKQSRLFLKVVKAALKLAESECKERRAEDCRRGYSAMPRPGGTVSEEKTPLRNPGETIVTPSKELLRTVCEPPRPRLDFYTQRVHERNETLSEENKSLRAEVEKLRRTINRKDAYIETQGVQIDKLIDARLSAGALLRKQAAEITELKKMLAPLLVGGCSFDFASAHIEGDRLREQELRKEAGKKSARKDTPPTEKTK